MISAADFSHVFPWMAERKPDPGIRVQIKANSDGNVEGREELTRRVDAAVSASLDQFSGQVPRAEVHPSDLNGE